MVLSPNMTNPSSENDKKNTPRTKGKKKADKKNSDAADIPPLDMEEIDQGKLTHSDPPSPNAKKAFEDDDKPTKDIPDHPPEPLTPTCPFHDFKCKFGGKHVTMIQAHVREEPIKHLGLLSEGVIEMLRMSGAMQMKWENLTAIYDRIYPQHDSQIKRYGAHLLWKIDKYEERFKSAEVGAKSVIFSPAFLTSRHGYNLILSAALYGDGKTARGKYMSVFVSILRGDHDALLGWPFNHPIKLTLIDQSNNVIRNHISHIVQPNAIEENAVFLNRPDHERNASFGIQRFIDLDALQNLDYIKEDTLYIKAEITQDMHDVL